VNDTRFQGRGWDDLAHWIATDRKTAGKIVKLLDDAWRHPATGLGKPEALSGELSGYWSRRIDGANRLVYRFCDGAIEVIQCRGHYSDH
jgi:toxin YoeB